MRIWKEMKFLVLLGINSVILQILQCIVLAGPARRSSRMIREVYPEIESEKLETSQAEVCIVGDVVYGAGEPVPADQPCLKCKCEPPGVQCETTRCAKKPGCKAIHKPNECCPEYQCECQYRNKVYANGERLETSAGGECKVCYCRGGEVQCAEVSCYIRIDCEGRTVPGQCCPKYDHCPPREPTLDRPYTAQPISISSEAWSSNLTQENYLVTDGYQEIVQEFKEPQEDNIQKITIQEIIPEIKEIPITGPPKRDITHLTHAQSLEAKTTNKIHEVSDAETESSEISEIFHHPPPILKIGDQLLVLKKGELIPKQDISTPRPVITVIGAEGLQRGTEDSAETHEIISKNDYSLTPVPHENKFTYTETPKTLEQSSEFSEKCLDPTVTFQSSVNLMPLNVTESNAITASIPAVGEKFITVKQFEHNSVQDENTSDKPTSSIPLLDKQNIATVEVTSLFAHPELSASPTPDSKSDHPKVRQEEETIIEQNPEYPPIPDIMISQTQDDGETDFFPTNVDDHLNATEETDKSSNRTEHPLINIDASLPTILLDSIAPSDRVANAYDVSKSIKESINSSYADKSKETVEETVSEESKEFTTSSSASSVPMISVEDASIEAAQFNESDFFSSTSILQQDVEVIDAQTLENTHAEKNKNNSNALKNKNNSETYNQLAEELKTTPTNIIDNKTDEDREAEAIFRELLDEATSSIPPAEHGFVEVKQKESALLRRVSEAIMKYQEQESKESLDTSILGILRDFFSSQYKYYEKKN